MYRSIPRLCAGLLALLTSSVVLAATVTVTPSGPSPNPSNPLVGETFTLTVSGAGFPDTVGATLKIFFDDTKVAILTPTLTNGIVLAAGSPFTGGIATPTATGLFPSGGNFSILAPTVGTLPSGTFDAFQIVFTALAVGNASISLFDDQADFSWTEDVTFAAIPVTYTQANIVVLAAPTEANISVSDSVAPVNDLTVPFGNVTAGTTNSQTVTVTNAGGVDLSIGLIASTNPLAAPFSITNDTCSSQTLTPSSSCTVSIRFSPSALVAAADSFSIPSDDPDSPLVTVTLNGTGTPTVPNIAVTDSIPDVNDRALPFSGITINTTISGTVTVANTGNGALTIGVITPPAAPFSVTADSCSSATLAPLDSCTVTVRFAPGTVQAFGSSFVVPSDDPDEPSVSVGVSGTGLPAPAPVIVVTDSLAPMNDRAVPFGDVTQGGVSTQTVTVANAGNTGLLIGQVASANPLAAPFTVANDNCSNQTVSPAASCSFQVVFTPTALGVFNDALDIPSNDPGAAIVSVSGTGIAVTVPDVSVTDSVAPENDLQIPFGTVDLADVVDQTVTVTNDGSGDLVMGIVGAGNALAAPFSIPAAEDNCSGATLAPTESCTFLVRFAPSAEVDSLDSFSIPSNDPDEASVLMGVSGSGVNNGNGGGGSALDPWSLALLIGLPFIRRRRWRPGAAPSA